MKKLKIPGIAESLVNKAASRGRIGNDLLGRAHTVRAYRNRLVHDRKERTEPIPIRKVTSDLCTFVSQLQLKW